MKKPRDFATIIHEFEQPLGKLPEAQSTLVAHFLKRYLPCPEPEKFNRTLQLFKHLESDSYSEDVAQALEELYQALKKQNLSFNSKHSARDYTVASSLNILNNKLQKISDISDAIRTEALELYLDMCGAGHDAPSHTEYSDSQLYNHILAIRDTLLKILKSPKAIAELEHTSLRLLFISIIESENDYEVLGSTNSTDKRKLQWLHEIFGPIPRRHFGCNLLDDTAKVADTDPPNPKEPRAPSVKVISARERLTRQTNQHNLNPSNQLTEPIPKGTTPKPRTKHKNRRSITITIPYLASATGGDLICDTSSRSLRQIGVWLDYLTDIDARVMLGCLISFTTGIRLSRLTQLRSTTDPITDNSIHLNTQTSTLHYAVTDYEPAGIPTEAGEIPLNNIVQLPIPHEWTTLLLNSETESHLPLKTVIDDYDKIRKRKHPSELTKLPRTQTWSLSTPEFDQDLFTTIESSIKAGRMDTVHSAPAAYRRLDPNMLSQKFNTALRSIIIHFAKQNLSALLNCGLLVSRNDRRIDPIHFIGSKFAMDPTQILANFTAALFKKRHQLIHALNKAPRVNKLNLLVDIANLQQVYFYMLLQVVSLGRPIGAKTKISINHYGIWVSDKPSRLFNERKVIPWTGKHGKALSNFVLQQAHINQTMSEMLLNYVTASELTKASINPPASLVGFYTLEHKQQRLKRSLATFSEFRSQLQHFALDHLLPVKGNLLRHYFATTWASIHHDCTLYEALGHKHERREVWGEESSATPAMMEWIASAQYQLLTDAQFLPFTNPNIG